MVSGICFSTSGVQHIAGADAVTVTPKVATSSATVLVRPAMPCLAVDIGDLNGEATSEWAEAVLMMRPHLRAFMPGTAARMAWKAADRLMAMICVPFLDRELLDRRDVLDAGIVDQDVDRAERLLGRRRSCRRSRPAWSCRRPNRRALTPNSLLEAGALRLDRGLVAEAVDHDVGARRAASAGRCRARCRRSSR